MLFTSVFYQLVSFAPLALVMHCLFILFFKRWLGPIGTFYASIFMLSSAIILSLIELYWIQRDSYYAYFDLGRWFFCVDVIDSNLMFCIDTLALVSSVLVMFLTMFALYFGVEYMYREAFIGRLLYLLNLFATSVIFLFYCYDYFLILFAWECIGLFSLLLVNFYSTRVYTIKAALKTFVFSRISDLFMFLSFILTITVFNSTDLSIIFVKVPFMAFHYIYFSSIGFHFLTIFSFCLVTSGAVKAAQFFFHVWLPDAMEAPTPASALIHSSTLVIAGIFLIIRFSVLFEFTSFTNYYMSVLGALTLSFGAITATFQNDIKKLVAYSTISQIGYLMCGCGFGCYEEVLIYLIIHALNKAFLFILVGYTVHFFSGNTDLRQMGGSYIYSFDILVLLTGVCFNLAGLPYSAGFLGKEFLINQVLRDDFIVMFVRACWLVSFFFTPIYMFTLVFNVMFGVKKGSLNVYSSTWDLCMTSIMRIWQVRLGGEKPVPNYSYTPTYPTSPCDNQRLGTLVWRTRFNQTAVISKLTTYILFYFWLLFFFFGESLLLLVFNFSSLVDLISSASFFSIKHHFIFYIASVSTYLIGSLEFYILILMVYAFVHLILMFIKPNYSYFSNSSRILRFVNLVFITLII